MDGKILSQNSADSVLKVKWLQVEWKDVLTMMENESLAEQNRP